MAVDSRDKRGSVLGWGLASLLVLPAPGTLDQPDRQHVAYSYRGIEAAEATVVDGDEVTTANAYFARAATVQDGLFPRAVTAEDSYYARAVTAEDSER